MYVERSSIDFTELIVWMIFTHDIGFYSLDTLSG